MIIALCRGNIFQTPGLQPCLGRFADLVDERHGDDVFSSVPSLVAIDLQAELLAFWLTDWTLEKSVLAGKDTVGQCLGRIEPGPAGGTASLPA